jgi:hypothetical protein
MSRSQLLDPPEPLHRGRIQQGEVLGENEDVTVNRISYRLGGSSVFGHGPDRI